MRLRDTLTKKFTRAEGDVETEKINQKATKMTNIKNEDVITPDRWDGRQGMM